MDSRNIEEIADAISEMIENPELRDDLALQAKESLRCYWMSNIENSLKRIYIGSQKSK